jgi:hypothetical protein
MFWVLNKLFSSYLLKTRTNLRESLLFLSKRQTFVMSELLERDNFNEPSMHLCFQSCDLSSRQDTFCVLSWARAV